MARVRNFGWWCHHEVSAVLAAWNPGLTEQSREQLRQDWPRIADTLDALDAAEQAGCPQCPARYPIYHIHDTTYEVVGWAAVGYNDDLVADEALECHLRFGHAGPHRHEDDCATIEWGA